MGRSFRKGQIVGPAGPGAIVDLGDESFVVMSIDTWRQGKMEPCDLDRLSKRLGVSRLLQPRSGDHSKPNSSIGILRFPRWMFCPACRSMVCWTEPDELRLSELSGTGKPVCRMRGCSDSVQLVPMRFVQICEMGHMDDIDWLYWVHDGGHQCQIPESLKFESLPGRGTGLGSLQIRCTRCGKSRGLDDLHRLKHVCRSETAWSGGRQPWQRKDAAKPCDQQVSVVQRGDSNVHFSSTVSALDIPEPGQSEEEDPFHNVILNNEFQNAQMLWSTLQQHVPIGSVRSAIEERFTGLHERLGISHEQLLQLLEGSHDSHHEEPQPVGDPVAILKAEEFVVIAQPERWRTSKFSGNSYVPAKEDFGFQLSDILERVSLIDRLREVRAIRGFHRKTPSEQGFVKAALDPSVDWLPAHEVFGEGIFMKFNAKFLSGWSDTLPLEEHKRIERLQKRILDQGIGFLPLPPSAYLIAMHTLSHLLMRQLCFDSGYASSSLREKLYVDGDSLGLLIYTADGDSEGTLGGLVRQGRSDRLPKVFARALKAAAWCSGDPLCSEGENQGMAGLNRAACHACVLVSETSCEYANALLDRRFLVGESGRFDGLFTQYLNEQGIA